MKSSICTRIISSVVLASTLLATGATSAVAGDVTKVTNQLLQDMTGKTLSGADYGGCTAFVLTYESGTTTYSSMLNTSENKYFSRFEFTVKGVLTDNSGGRYVLPATAYVIASNSSLNGATNFIEKSRVKIIKVGNGKIYSGEFVNRVTLNSNGVPVSIKSNLTEVCLA